MDCNTPGLLVHHLLKLMATPLVKPSNHLILCRPLLLPPSIFPSIRVFSNESVLCIRWPKYWSFTFSNSLSNEYSGLISFRIGWFDHLSVKELSNLLRHHGSKASIFWRSDFFMVQPSHPYLTTGKMPASLPWSPYIKFQLILVNTSFLISFCASFKKSLVFNH